MCYGNHDGASRSLNSDRLADILATLATHLCVTTQEYVDLLDQPFCQSCAATDTKLLNTHMALPQAIRKYCTNCTTSLTTTKRAMDCEKCHRDIIETIIETHTPSFLHNTTDSDHPAVCQRYAYYASDQEEYYCRHCALIRGIDTLDFINGHDFLSSGQDQYCDTCTNLIIHTRPAAECEICSAELP
ncbi:hypothetical protein ANTQUA_LOCUS8270 [Anthophora quadrimaculata]